MNLDFWTPLLVGFLFGCMLGLPVGWVWCDLMWTKYHRAVIDCFVPKVKSK